MAGLPLAPLKRHAPGVVGKYAPQALRVLVAALGSQYERVRIEVASTLLDRGFGKAAQLVEYQGEVEFRLGALDDATLEALIRERLKGLGLTGPRPALPANTPNSLQSVETVNYIAGIEGAVGVMSTIPAETAFPEFPSLIPEPAPANTPARAGNDQEGGQEAPGDDE